MFLAHVDELARERDPEYKPEEAQFLDDAAWRKAWRTTDIFTIAKASVPIPIGSPTALLKNLDRESRKKLFEEYLREHFPIFVGDNPSVFALALSLNAGAIDIFMSIGQKMHNERLIAPGIDANVKKELASLYLTDPDPATGKSLTKPCALDDFIQAMHRHPTASADPAHLKLALENDRLPIAAAVRLDVFTEEHLAFLAENHRQKKLEEQVVKTAKMTERNVVRSQIERQQMKNAVEKMKENFSNLESWQKLAVVGLGGWYLWRLFSKKGDELSQVEYWVVRPAAAIGLFYLTGARDMVRGTIVDDGLTAVEDYVGSWVDHARGGVTKTPALDDADLETYIRFINEVATDELGEQVQAMSFLSQVPFGAIAGSFTLSADGKTGELDFGRSSPLVSHVNEFYGSTGQSFRVRRLLQAHSTELGDSIAHVFYMLGARKNPVDHQNVRKEMRDNGIEKYDDLPDGSVGRTIYKRLAFEGLSLAKTDDYKETTWIEMIDAMVREQHTEDMLFSAPGRTVRAWWNDIPSDRLDLFTRKRGELSSRGMELFYDGTTGEVMVGARWQTYVPGPRLSYVPPTGRPLWTMLNFGTIAFPLTKTWDELMVAEPDELKKEWIKEAFLQKKTDPNEGVEDPGAIAAAGLVTFTVKRDGDTAVKYQSQSTDPEAVSPIEPFLTTPRERIYERYERWSNDRVLNRLPAALGTDDPLTY